MRETVHCTAIAMLRDEDGLFLFVGESLGRWDIILAYAPSWQKETRLPEDKSDIIFCEKITVSLNEDEGVHVVGESQERGVIILSWNPDYTQTISQNKSQPALFI